MRSSHHLPVCNGCCGGRQQANPPDAAVDVRLGSLASVLVLRPYVRSHPDSDRNSDLPARRLSATSGLMQCSKSAALTRARNRSSTREMLHVHWQLRPTAHLLLPYRRHGRWKIPIVEAANGDAKLIWTKIKCPADRRATSRTKVVVEFASLRTVSGIDFVLPLKPNFRLREIGVAG
jgi:hypothetical protein